MQYYYYIEFREVLKSKRYDGQVIETVKKPDVTSVQLNLLHSKNRRFIEHAIHS